MARPRLLDAFCAQGGASYGYGQAGFEVTGVDKDPQPRYPYPFIMGGAITYILEHGHEYDVIAASPPCQRYSATQVLQGNDHPDLIGPTREVLEMSGRPWVIENVEGARSELRDPVMLCGASFGLHTYRHRLFESPVHLEAPLLHPPHVTPNEKMGRALRDGDQYIAVGNFSNVDYVRRDMGVPWMNRDGIRECIPPAYAEFIGRQLMAVIR